MELTDEFLAYTFLQVSAIMILIVAFERFLHIKCPLHYQTYVKKKAKLQVAFNVILAFCIASCSVVASQRKKFFIFKVIQLCIDVCIYVVIKIFLTFSCWTAHEHISQKRKLKEQLQLTRLQLEIKIASCYPELAKYSNLIVKALVIFYLPYFLQVLFMPTMNTTKRFDQVRHWMLSSVELSSFVLELFFECLYFDAK